MSVGPFRGVQLVLFRGRRDRYGTGRLGGEHLCAADQGLKSLLGARVAPRRPARLPSLA
jgi:hypothetical protein